MHEFTFAYAETRDSDPKPLKAARIEDAKKEAMQRLLEQGYNEGDTFYIRALVGAPIPRLTAKEFLEGCAEKAVELYGAQAEGWLESLDDRHLQKLDAQLKPTLEKWLGRYGHKPKFFTLGEAVACLIVKIDDPKGGGANEPLEDDEPEVGDDVDINTDDQDDSD